jgi:hypothetical protein
MRSSSFVAAFLFALALLASSFAVLPGFGAVITPFVPPEPTSVGSTPISDGSLSLNSFKIGQTYMFTAPMKKWYKKSDEVWIDAHLSGNRSTLFVIKFGSSVPTNPELI